MPPPAAISHQEDEFRANLDAGLWIKVFKRALRVRNYLLLLLFAAIVTSLIESSLVFLIRWAIDGAVEHGTAAPFALYAAAFATYSLAFGTSVWFFIRISGNLAHRLAHDIRLEGFQRLQELEFSYYDTHPIGWLISRLTSDCDRLARIIAWGTRNIAADFFYVVIVSFALLWMNWQLGLIVIAALPPFAVISIWFQRRMLRSARDVRRYNSQIIANYSESIQGVRTTKTLVREQQNLTEFQGLTGRMFAASVLNARQNAFYFPIVTTLGAFASGLALWRGGYLVFTDALSLGTLVAFVQFAGHFFHPLNDIARMLAEMQAAQAAGERVMGLLATEPKIKDSAEVETRIKNEKLKIKNESEADAVAAVAPDGHSARIGAVEFRNVTFHYETGPDVLTDFNLTVRTGQTIALVGASGGGKSTIVSLVCRFYEPTSGAILVDGLDYRERSLLWFQSQLGIVLQTPHLFQGSVRDNIRYGRLNATDAQVEDAARLVNAHPFIMQLEHGYDTAVGENGNRLSTGQKQLVSFARALLADPQIFVMDEATSSIDTETEQLIQRGLETVLRGRISFVIAHRLSTVRTADCILVINKGRIEESGTHAELLAKRGHYYELYTSQFRRELEAEVLERDLAC
ncbi:MAG: ABC transporter ATP-binding protein/permease [Puniceicoccales bacterium]|nr:ABC transporter ATP-binding protein/permease [Puniceicoccales bacterium]